MIYFVVLLLIVVLSYRYDYCRKESGRLFWYLITFLILVCVAGLRYRLGTDSVRYETYYKNMPMLWELDSYNWAKDRFEPGFVILMSVCRSISSDFTLFQFVHAIILNICVFLFFYKNTRHIFFGIFFYCLILYIQLNYEVLRESLAVGIFLISWEFFKKNNYIVYYLFILLAICFHIGSAFCLLCPLFLLPGINFLFTFGKRTIPICLGVIALGFVINLLFFDIVRLMTFSATMADRATAYSKNELGGTTLNLLGALGVSLRWVVFPWLGLYFTNKIIDHSNKLKENYWRHLETMTLVSMYIGCVSIPISIFFRFNDYFYFFSILAMSLFVFENLRLKKKRLKLSFMYWTIMFIPLIAIQIKGQFGNVNFSGTLKSYMSYYPYASRLDPVEDRNREAVFRYYKSW